jgi:hypothetical protein
MQGIDVNSKQVGQFSGTLASVTIDARGETVRDPEAQLRAVMAHP